MPSPFTQALELAWNDGGLSIKGARLLEVAQTRLGMSDLSRTAIEEKWLNEKLIGRQRKGFGAGDNSLREWLEKLPTREEMNKSAHIIGCAGVKNGLSKNKWAEAYAWAEDYQLGNAFATGVWTIESCSDDAEWHQMLAPLAEILGL